ncbi:hypothetical protein Y032_0040g187 [Ancylostoma ceylanicum]|nr:hypothetical protein Y032_0040g187 [Ancylostoma ceylanicum]
MRDLNIPFSLAGMVIDSRKTQPNRQDAATRAALCGCDEAANKKLREQIGKPSLVQSYRISWPTGESCIHGPNSPSPKRWPKTIKAITISGAVQHKVDITSLARLPLNLAMSSPCPRSALTSSALRSPISI